MLRGKKNLFGVYTCEMWMVNIIETPKKQYHASF